MLLKIRLIVKLYKNLMIKKKKEFLKKDMVWKGLAFDSKKWLEIPLMGKNK